MDIFITYVKKKVESQPQNKFFLMLEKYATPRAISQFLRYLVVGFSCFGLEYVLFYILMEFGGASKYAANSIALGIIFWCNFLLNRIWSFQSKQKLPKQLLYYGILFCFNIVMSNVLLNVLSGLLENSGMFRADVAPYAAKIFIQGLIVCWNFILYKTVIYKN